MNILCHHWKTLEKVNITCLKAETYKCKPIIISIFIVALNFSNDLIGAILIPFGTSGPEIFSSAVGVFFAKSDIGTGAIIGSAVFNMLAIPAACGLAATYFIGYEIQLEEVSILRDLLFYMVSIVSLVLVVKDNKVDL